MIRSSLIVGLILAAGAATVVYLYSIFVPQYEARALLRIDAERPYLVQPNEHSDPDFIDNQLGWIRSSPVLGPVLAQRDIATLPAVVRARASLGEGQQVVDCIRTLLDVSLAWGTEYYHISCVTSDPESSAMIVNAVADSYFTVLNELEDGRTQLLIRLLEREREVSEREVQRLRDNVRVMAVDQTGIDPFNPCTRENGEEPPRPFDGLKNRLTDVSIETMLLRARIVALEKEAAEVEDAPEAASTTIEEAVKLDAFAERITLAIAERRFRIVELELAKETSGEDVKSGSLRLVKEIQLLETNLSKRREELKKSLNDDLDKIAADRRNAQIAILNEELSYLVVEERTLARAYEDKLKPFTGDSLMLKMRKAELTRAEKVLDSISERVFALRTEQRAPRRVELLAHATVPSSPVRRVPFLTMIVASLVGFFAPLLFALLVAAACRYNQSAHTTPMYQEADAPSDQAANDLEEECPVEK